LYAHYSENQKGYGLIAYPFSIVSAQQASATGEQQLSVANTPQFSITESQQPAPDLDLNLFL
jgi:hypothetical protein